MYVVLGVAVVLVSLAVLSMFGTKNTTTINPVATSTTESTTANGMQVYRNEKFGFQFEYPNVYALTATEKGEKNWQGIEGQDVLVVYAMNPNYQSPVNILSVVQGSRWGDIKKDIQELVDGPIKATKKVFEKPYGTVTSIEGVTGRDGDTFCDLYIKNPTKEYIVLVSCGRTPLLDSLTFF
jgi:hypothetical protein